VFLEISVSTYLRRRLDRAKNPGTGALFDRTLGDSSGVEKRCGDDGDAVGAAIGSLAGGDDHGVKELVELAAPE
jgi:hypothetical protein